MKGKIRLLDVTNSFVFFWARSSLTWPTSSPLSWIFVIQPSYIFKIQLQRNVFIHDIFSVNNKCQIHNKNQLYYNFSIKILSQDSFFTWWEFSLQHNFKRRLWTNQPLYNFEYSKAGCQLCCWMLLQCRYPLVLYWDGG